MARNSTFSQFNIKGGIMPIPAVLIIAFCLSVGGEFVPAKSFINAGQVERNAGDLIEQAQENSEQKEAYNFHNASYPRKPTTSTQRFHGS